MDDDTDWILMDFGTPKCTANTGQKPSAAAADKPQDKRKKTGAQNKTGAGATKVARKARATFKSKKV